ncbi:MAG TPA: hypothetical protein VFS42_06880 [Burkholderiaceae bacterium]|nr:hypothetical protein [Burkholderiaceae bacterium]
MSMHSITLDETQLNVVAGALAQAPLGTALDTFLTLAAQTDPKLFERYGFVRANSADSQPLPVINEEVNHG